MSVGWDLIRILWEGSASKIIQSVGRMQFLVVVGLRSPLTCWLSAGGYIELTDASLQTLHTDSYLSDKVTVCWILNTWNLFLFLLLYFSCSGQSRYCFVFFLSSDLVWNSPKAICQTVSTGRLASLFFFLLLQPPRLANRSDGKGNQRVGCSILKELCGSMQPLDTLFWGLQT